MMPAQPLSPPRRSFVLSMLLLGLCGACGGSSTPATGPDAGPDAGPTTATLTLSNFDSWCSLSVTQPAGTVLPTGATAASNTVVLAIGTVVKLHGEPASASFEWAPSAGHGGWSGGIDPGQDPLSKDTTVTLSADKAVAVCCPFTNGTGCP